MSGSSPDSDSHPQQADAAAAEEAARNAIELTSADLADDGISNAARWGDQSQFARHESSPFAAAAVGFSLFGLIAAVFSFWWPALVIAPFAFGPGLSFAYLAVYDIRKNQLAGWRSSLIGWAMGYVAVILWHLFLFAAFRPALDVAWHFAAVDIHVLWLVGLIALGIAHLLFLTRTPALARFVVLGLMLTTLATLVAVGLLETRREANATVHKRRAGTLAIGVHQWLDTNPNTQATRAQRYWQRRGQAASGTSTETSPADDITADDSGGIPSVVWWLVVPVVGGIAWLGFLSWLSRQGPRDLFLDRTMSSCGKRPNCVSSKANDAAHSIEPIRFDCSLEEARQRLQLAISSQSGVNIEYREPNYWYATFRSRMLRFIDDAEFRIDPQEQVIHCRSASRVGRSDFGANRRRIEAIRSDFAAQYMMLERNAAG